MAETPLWEPSPERIARARLTAFSQRASQLTGLPLEAYDALWAWSVENPAAFWKLVWEELDVVRSAEPVAVLEDARMPGARWFRGARLSFAENLLRHRGDAPAILAVDESGAPPVVVSRDALRAQVARAQRWLAAQGVGVGDRVAAWLPNRVEAVVTMLAASSLGAIYSSTSPDFGLQGVLDRFGQIAPKVLVTSDGTRYAGKVHGLLDKVAELAERLGSDLVAVAVVPALGTPPDLTGLPRAVTWDEVVAGEATEPTFAQLPFDHPLYVLYSSGTTGVPKCIVHGQGGTLLQHAKELLLHVDARPDDVLFYFTTTGWMMWNWLVSGLLTGAPIVLWDGSPTHPSADALWAMAERLGVTVFGTSPRFVAACAQAGLSPGREHDLSRLRTVLSTGSPLPEDGFRWIVEQVGPVQVASICGGTDIVSCFMLGVPTLPVWAGEIQRPGLGMAVAAWQGPNRPVVGERGELVCTVPFPSMPVGFWNDPDGSRYHKAYFGVFPGVWRHGDWVEVTHHGGLVVHGRSDSTLNPGGVRIGTAEIYRPVESHPAVADSVVVGLPRAADVEVVLFVVLRQPGTLDAGLERELRTAIREQASPRHVPARIVEAPAVPRTLSGKKVEVAVLQVLLGEAPPNRDALANPEALDWFATEGRERLG